MLAEVSTLPAGGPLDIDPKVAEVTLAHLEGVCAATPGASEVAFDKRDALLAMCSTAAIGQLAMVCRAILRLCEAATG
jgi:hypothetical protein